MADGVTAVRLNNFCEFRVFSSENKRRKKMKKPQIIVFILFLSFLCHFPFYKVFCNDDLKFVIEMENYDKTNAKSVERQIFSIPEAAKIASVDNDGTSKIYVDFQDNISYALSLTKLKEAISSVANPSIKTKTLISRYKHSADFPMLILKFDNDANDSNVKALETILSRIKGVRFCWATGSNDKEIAVEVNPERLQAKKIFLDDLFESLSSLDISHSFKGGTMEDDSFFSFRIMLTKEPYTLSDIENIIINKNYSQDEKEQGRFIRLKDVANVKLISKEEQDIVTYNTKRAKLISVYNESSFSPSEVINNIKTQLKDNVLLKGEKLEFLYDASVIDNDFIKIILYPEYDASFQFIKKELDIFLNKLTSSDNVKFALTNLALDDDNRDVFQANFKPFILLKVSPDKKEEIYLELKNLAKGVQGFKFAIRGDFEEGVLKISGDNRRIVNKIAEELSVKIKDVIDNSYVLLDTEKYISEIEVVLNNENMRKHNLLPKDIQKIILLAADGYVLERVMVKDEQGDSEAFNLRIKFKNKVQLKDLGEITFISGQGETISLNQVAALNFVKRSVLSKRENLKEVSCIHLFSKNLEDASEVMDRVIKEYSLKNKECSLTWEVLSKESN